MAKKDFILASSSPQRRMLLSQIGYEPKEIRPVNIDESEQTGELPLPYIRRITRAKAFAAVAQNPNENVLCADTIIVVGKTIIRKSPDVDTQRNVMMQLSGRTHRVITSVCFVNKTGKISQKTITTKIMMKHLSSEEIDEYLASNEWKGVAGYKIEGLLQGYVKKIVGSYSSVIGLPLYETKNILNGAGIK